tara:strand:- start:220 stop:564 length:345 start_codon:yes stop_codon:yes gene_type:complete
MDEGPPVGRDSPPDITGPRLSRRYPDTPMPGDPEEDSEDYSESEPDTKETSLFDNALKMVFIAIAITHLWTIWTLRTDLNIMMQFLKEITQQNIHITDLLHNQHQVKWQIVPTQ